MPSSISSSDTRGWLAAWVLALLLAGTGLAAVERHWRLRGYLPTVLDSTQLWSQQRARVYGDAPRPLVLLGASRMEYGVDTGVLRQQLPRYRPVMLAVNGLYPLAVLRDLAHDAEFRGVVLCDVESNGLMRDYFDLQQPWVDYFHRRWTPSWNLHRRVLTLWQRHALIANPDFGALAALKRAFAGGAPFRNYVTYYANRSGNINYTKTDPAATKKHFAETVEGNIARMPHREPEARGRAVVEDVEREAVEADELAETFHHPGQVVERIGELIPGRHRRASEAGQVGRDDMQAVGQAGNEVAEHVARAGEAVEQQQRGRLGIPGFAVEDIEPVDGDRAIANGNHLGFSPS